MSDNCRACGSVAGGTFVCHQCGAALHRLRTADEERDALDELHGRLAVESNKSILQNAFVPSDTRVLIDAGLRLLPVLEAGVAEDCAAGRLRAIIVKLELIGTDATASKAALELKKALDDYRRSDKIMTYWVVGFLFALVAGAAYWWWG